MEKKKKIKVLVVDDSVVVRNALTEILNSNAGIEVVDVASDPYDAVEKIAKQVPDVITLDIEMPKMNGLIFLKKLMEQHPIPVVVISSLTGDRSEVAIRALELGAANIITKPKLESQLSFEEYKIDICDSVKAAAITKPYLKKISKRKKVIHEQIIEKPSLGETTKFTSNKLILIGASTGGTEVISTICKSVRTDLPPIIVVQHMPGEFTKAFAQRLNNECDLTVKEAEDAETLYEGHVYIANGFKHLVVRKIENKYVCKVQDGKMVNRHRPSIDVLFKSVAELSAKNTMGILLTGMGVDGAQGLLDIKNKGGICIAQDEKTSVVFGMPKEAIKLGATNQVGGPKEIIEWINNFS